MGFFLTLAFQYILPIFIYLYMGSCPVKWNLNILKCWWWFLFALSFLRGHINDFFISYSEYICCPIRPIDSHVAGKCRSQKTALGDNMKRYTLLLTCTNYWQVLVGRNRFGGAMINVSVSYFDLHDSKNQWIGALLPSALIAPFEYLPLSDVFFQLILKNIWNSKFSTCIHMFSFFVPLCSTSNSGILVFRTQLDIILPGFLLQITLFSYLD